MNREQALAVLARYGVDADIIEKDSVKDAQLAATGPKGNTGKVGRARSELRVAINWLYANKPAPEPPKPAAKKPAPKKTKKPATRKPKAAKPKASSEG